MCLCLKSHYNIVMCNLYLFWDHTFIYNNIVRHMRRLLRPWMGTEPVPINVNLIDKPMGTFLIKIYDDIIKWKHFSRYYPFEGNPRSPVDSTQKGKWCGTLIFSLICAWRRDAGDLRRHRSHYDFTVMLHIFLHKLRTELHIDWLIRYKMVVTLQTIIRKQFFQMTTQKCNW